LCGDARRTVPKWLSRGGDARQVVSSRAHEGQCQYATSRVCPEATRSSSSTDDVDAENQRCACVRKSTVWRMSFASRVFGALGTRFSEEFSVWRRTALVCLPEADIPVRQTMAG